MDQILAQGLWAVRGIYGVLYTIRVENATAIFQTAWLFYGRRGGFFGRQGCFFQRGEAFAPKSFPSRGRCRRRRRKRCRIGSQFLSTDAKTERMTPLPQAGCHPPLEGRDFARSPFRRTQKRNEDHLFRHPACGRRRMPPSPRGEGPFACRFVPASCRSVLLSSRIPQG